MSKVVVASALFLALPLVDSSVRSIYTAATRVEYVDYYHSFVKIYVKFTINLCLLDASEYRFHSSLRNP